MLTVGAHVIHLDELARVAWSSYQFCTPKQSSTARLILGKEGMVGGWWGEDETNPSQAPVWYPLALYRCTVLRPAQTNHASCKIPQGRDKRQAMGSLIPVIKTAVRPLYGNLYRDRLRTKAFPFIFHFSKTISTTGLTRKWMDVQVN